MISFNIALESQKVLELAITYIQQHYYLVIDYTVTPDTVLVLHKAGTWPHLLSTS